MKKMVYGFSVVVLEDESGGYIAIVSELPGCHTQGASLDEVMRNIREAIELYLETLSEEEEEELLGPLIPTLRAGDPGYHILAGRH